MSTQKLTYSVADDFGGAFNREEFEIQIRGSYVTRSLRRVDLVGDVVDAVFNGADPIPSTDKDIVQGNNYPSPIGGLIAAHTGVVPQVRSVKVDGVHLADGDKLHVHASPRGPDEATYFSSAGDVTTPGDGPLLAFKLTATDTEKSVAVSYKEDVWIKDGYAVCENAPFGSTICAEVVAQGHPSIPDGTVVGAFVRRSLMLGTAFMPFDTEDKGFVPQGFELRLKVVNSDGTGDFDPPAEFKVVARVEMYRTATV